MSEHTLANELAARFYLGRGQPHLARHYLRQERPDHTLQSTALVHEAYLKLIDQRSVDFKNRGQFFALSAQAMRRILLDGARVKAFTVKPPPPGQDHHLVG